MSGQMLPYFLFCSPINMFIEIHDGRLRITYKQN